MSRQNRKIKTIRRLRRCKGDHAVLEGPHLVAEALQAGIELDEVLATPEFMEQAVGRRMERLLPRPPVLVTAPILDELADADSPRGLLAVARLARGGSETLPRGSDAVLVLADGLQDPGNLGALARAVEAGGGAALALTPGSVSPNHPRALRASAGSLLRLPVAVGVTLDDLRRLDFPTPPRVLALTAHGGESLYDLDEISGTLILVIGAEGPGVSAEAMAAAEKQITIPLQGAVESLNTAVAAAVVLFEIGRGRHDERG